MATKPNRFTVAYLDYTDMPRAWGAGPDVERADAEALRQLESYCAKQREYGEPNMSRVDQFTRKVLED